MNLGLNVIGSGRNDKKVSIEKILFEVTLNHNLIGLASWPSNKEIKEWMIFKDIIDDPHDVYILDSLWINDSPMDKEKWKDNQLCLQVDYIQRPKNTYTMWTRETRD